jgi:fluoride exporter
MALGAALGAMLREWIVMILDVPHPWILIAAINMIGAFIISVIYEIEHLLHRHVKVFGAIGFCGGFTTFSHFSNHTAKMITEGNGVVALCNIVLSLVGTFAAVYLGIAIVKLGAKIWRVR